MKPSFWPDWIENDLLAKSAGKGDGCEPESLPTHTWRALQRLAGFIELRPGLPQDAKKPFLWNALYWGTFLHDFGKSMPGFQGVLRGNKRSKAEWGSHRHEVFSLGFLEWIENSLEEEESIWLAAAIVSHHRDAYDIETTYLTNPDLSEEAIREQFSQFPYQHAQGLCRWLTECGWTWAKDLGLDRYGVVQIHLTQIPDSDFCKRAPGNVMGWLGRYIEFIERHKYEKSMDLWPALILLRGHLIQADHSASAHVPAVSKPNFEKNLILRPLKKNKINFEDLYFHQRRSAIGEGSALLTAPTGSGKTEAALLWASNLHNHNPEGLPRLFYTLPYQASMNAMVLRLKGYYGDQQVGLQHGRSLLSIYRMLLEKSYHPSEASRMAQLERNLARLNFPPVKVFSPFQMLKAIYRLKGYEAMLCDFYNAAFIFDEIHAYEPARLAMILKMIEYLKKQFGAQFFIMSATFPKLIKNTLNESLNSPDEIEAEPGLFEKFQRHRIIMLEGEILDRNSLNMIIQDAKKGKKVLVVCNLVDRAQTIYEWLEKETKGIEIELLHGRFNMRDRSQKEARIREATGVNTMNQKPMILVATQAVEVSLNIDLDTIYSDPAPLEALIQRFGRVNRANKSIDLAPVHIFRNPDDGQKIYDEALVKKALSILDREDGRPLDESKVGHWLNEIYTGIVAQKWLGEFNKSAAEFESVCVKTLRPFDADEQLEETFYQTFDGIDVLPEVLYDEYERLVQEDHILSRELLVTISWGRYMALANKGLLRPRERNKPPIVIADYQSNMGLTFKTRDEID